jgi:multiple sugar transport system substrate-binding protein
MSKKTWTTVMIVVLVVAAAVGVYFLTRPEPVVADSPASGGGGAKTKVTIWHTFTEGQEAYLRKAIEDFNAQSEGITVELLQQPYADFLKSVYSSVVEGIGPDIIFNYASEAAQYLNSGKLTDLSQYIYDEEIGIPGFEDALSQGVLEGEVLGFEDGLIHYVPAYTTGPILYYNKTLFEELQLQVPTTWEEMEAAARKIHEAKGVAGLGTDGLTDIVQMLIMETPGAGYIDVQNKQVLFDTPEVREKVRWLVGLAREGVVAVKSTGDYFSTDFNSGIVGSYIGSCGGFPYIAPDGFEFDVAPMPAQTWYPSWNRGPIVFYYQDDARAEAAYEFVKYFISADVNAGWAEAVIALAPYAWTRDTEAYKAYVAQDTLAVQALGGVQAHLDKAGSLPAVTGANVVRNAIRDAIIKAASGEMTADDAWTEAVTRSNAALKGE